MANPGSPRYIQITQLPNLEEINHELNETSIDKILAKAIALQLKPLNAEITKFAFDHLLMLLDEQLDDMIGELHKISNIQRRESVAKGDLQLFLQGLNISPSDLELQGQLSQYVSLQFKKEYDLLHALKESYSKTTEDEGEQIENVLTKLVPPTNSLRLSIPKWLPALPPDHTYKFTPQFNHPITDEIIIRKKIVEEGKRSELALLHLLRGTDKGGFEENPIPDFDEALEKEETLAVYGFGKRKMKQDCRILNSSELLTRLPQANFNVEEYARRRVEISRKRVVDFEEKTLQFAKNPFLKGSKLMMSGSNDKVTKRQANKEIRSMLKRSFYGMIKSIPELTAQKKQAREIAESKRNERLEEMKILQEQKLKEKNERVKNGEIDLLDLEHHDEFFGSLDSSEEEETSGTESQTAPLPQLPIVPTLEGGNSQSYHDGNTPTSTSAANTDHDAGQHIGQDLENSEIPLKSPQTREEMGSEEIEISQPRLKLQVQNPAESPGSGSENDDDSGFLFEDITHTNGTSNFNANDIEL